MNKSSRQSSAEACLWSEVIKRGRQDLVSQNTRNALLAARYFFLEPVSGDDRNIRTFTGLCVATKINADAAARVIFEALKPEQQTRILGLLRDACYEGIRSEVVM